MSSRAAAALVLAAVAVLVCFAIAAGRSFGPPARASADPPDVASPLDPVVQMVQAQSGRLRKYLDSMPPLAQTARDPFKFSDQAAPGARAPSAPALSAAEATLSTRPALALAGVAEDPTPAGPARTAIITGMGQLFLVKEGETFAGRFKIVRIGADAIQVLDQADGSSFTLALK